MCAFNVRDQACLFDIIMLDPRYRLRLDRSIVGRFNFFEMLDETLVPDQGVVVAYLKKDLNQLLRLGD
jgi:hypothetical protein